MAISKRKETAVHVDGEKKKITDRKMQISRKTMIFGSAKGSMKCKDNNIDC